MILGTLLRIPKASFLSIHLLLLSVADQHIPDRYAICQARKQKVTVQRKLFTNLCFLFQCRFQ